MTHEVEIEYLAGNPDVLPVLREWFETEWASYYGADGPGDAEHDIRSFANRGSLPVGIVALQQGVPCGVAALKADWVDSYSHLSPWAAAGLVTPSMRGKGIGARLLAGLEHAALELGFASIYCATSTANSLLERCSWELIETILHEGEDLGIYRKALERAAS